LIYLKEFKILNEDEEWRLLVSGEKRRIYNNIYPFKIFSEKEFENISFSDITILYGNNGSGKTTLLNIIANKLKSFRKNELDFGRYFNMYVDACEARLSDFNYPDEIKMISSDDIFDYLLDIQAINSNVNRKKEELAKEYLEYKYSPSENFYNDYEKIKQKNKANSQTVSRYIRERLGTNNIISQSNGETALLFWEREIKENAIYILDEPENSLSAVNQVKLKKFIEESVRFFNCQFIISSHSPIFLSLNDAKIYDLDSTPVKCKEWMELENVKVYVDLFKDYIK
jgi:predicted ATPase